MEEKLVERAVDVVLVLLLEGRVLEGVPNVALFELLDDPNPDTELENPGVVLLLLLVILVVELEEDENGF